MKTRLSTPEDGMAAALTAQNPQWQQMLTNRHQARRMGASDRGSLSGGAQEAEEKPPKIAKNLGVSAPTQSGAMD